MTKQADVLDGAVVLTTNRLKLRSFLPADVSGYAALNADPEVMRYLGGIVTRAQSESILIGAQRSFANFGYGMIAVERADDGVFLGTCGLSVETWYPDDFEIGWRLARKYWGQGYASEAGSAWLAYAFDALKAVRIISIADTPNVRSISVMQKLGLHFDHTARLDDNGEIFDATIYSLSAAEFRTR